MKNKIEITKLFKGFRVGQKRAKKPNYKFLEKLNGLTKEQHDSVQVQLDLCYYTKGEEKICSAHLKHVQRLERLLFKEIVYAKVDSAGNSWTKPEPVEVLKVEKLK